MHWTNQTAAAQGCIVVALGGEPHGYARTDRFAALNAGLADARIKGRLTDLGGEPMPMSPGEFGRLVADETEKWGKVIRAANIRLDGG
jgi:hypothetical protein